MSEPKPWRLWVDGEERTSECAGINFGVPALVYDVPHDGPYARRELGPKGFWVVLVGASEQLYALADGGGQVRQLKLTFGDQALPVPVRFRMAWTEGSGVRKVFGCLAHDESGDPMWVTEPISDEGQRPLTLATKEG
jgi:hypothetical protein